MSQTSEDKALILFDGECGLCQRAVQFVLKRDPHAKFRFASLQSEAAKRAVQDSSFEGELPDSIVLITRSRVRVRSSAALAIARGLRWPWPLLTVFWLVPYPLRDLIYDWVARNRLRWFERPAACMLPTPEMRARFADADETRDGASD